VQKSSHKIIISHFNKLLPAHFSLKRFSNFMDEKQQKNKAFANFKESSNPSFKKFEL